MASSETSSSYEERTCSRCFKGFIYNGQRGEWVECEACEGSGRAPVFVYPKRRLWECAECSGHFSGRSIFDGGENNLAFFQGDLLCGECAHGVL